MLNDSKDGETVACRNCERNEVMKDIPLKVYIDQLTSEYAKGWAVRTDNFLKKLRVQSYLFDELVGEAVADNFREDLLSISPDGKCEFLLRFTRPVQSEDFHKIEFLCEPLTANDVEIPYCNSTITIGELRRRVRDLGPWHHEIEILPGISTKTAISLDACTAAFNWWMGPLLRAMYPSGLTERSFLDVGCNGGGYSWVASRCGAGEIYGFDARGKWIEQAVFLKGLYPNWQKVEFVTHTLDEFYLKEKRKFSVVNYAGLLYHVFDPIESLKLLSERAEEVLFVESATKSELHSGELVPDGAFVMHDVGVEGPNHQLCGLERIEWYPSGPEVIKRVLIHLGFESAETVFWRRYVHGGKHPIGRMCVVGVRNKKMLATKAVILCLEHLNSFNRTFATPKNVIEEVNRDH